MNIPAVKKIYATLAVPRFHTHFIKFCHCDSGVGSAFYTQHASLRGVYRGWNFS